MIGSPGKRRPFGNEKPDGPDPAGNDPAFTKKRPYRWLNQLYDRCCFPRVFGTRSDPDQPPRSAWISASFALSARGMRGAFASSSVESLEGFFSYSA